ncbi:hypothetical protein G647_08900 [Cladophialophora carrionii CBS 160.54]|uniref:SnoaL-like domain-containing protein n=1 Tax=Cladophialophora carrionii CBS 160.54 TaxID=1279043 RepID=V9CZ45_9EURO|nr:uncharacterized protein G647_08900 [Cladophialophora carrionii CBS 160.54]ETI19885.1 hypothetical protein G647_08900 [Cladophialophora carrionii CBS 160.54]
MATSPAVQAATLNKFIEAWRDQDVEGTVALWSDDFSQTLLPSSLGMPPKPRETAEIVYSRLTQSLTNWKLDVKEIVHDAAQGTAAVYATSLADLPMPGEKWTMDYAVFMSFAEGGTKISRLNEMVDTSNFQQLFPKLQKYLMEKSAVNGTK